MASGYRWVVTETRPRRLCSSTKENFSDSVDGDAFSTTLCGVKVGPDYSKVLFGVVKGEWYGTAVLWSQTEENEK